MSENVRDTSEATIKKWAKEVLKEFGAYYYMPVVGGIGATGLDFHCCVRHKDNFAIAFFIETKKLHGKPTARQQALIDELWQKTGARTFIVDGMVTLNELRAWLKEITERGII